MARSKAPNRSSSTWGPTGTRSRCSNPLPIPLLVHLGNGSDKFEGNDEPDTCYPEGSGPGDDICHMGPGQDGCHGESENDRLYGGPDPDQLYGGPGRDYCDGGPGVGYSHGCELGPGH